MDDGIDIARFVQIVKRRFWLFFLPSVALIAIAAFVIRALPPVYQSTATILIESQDIPRDLVRSTVNTFANERLEVITRLTTTTANLTELIRKVGLYKKEQKTRPMSELAGLVREKFSIKVLEANVTDGRSGRTSKATIAFNLSFEHENPNVARRVVNEFVSLYISANLRTRREKAAETKRFLEQQAKKIAKTVAALEAALTRFKQQNAGLLPDQMRIVYTSLGREEGRLQTLIQQIDILKRRRAIAEQALKQTPRYLAQATARQRASSAQQQVDKLRLKLSELRSRYGQRHPYVRRAVRQLALLEAEIKKQESSAEKTGGGSKELSQLEKKLAQARSKYTERHPVVVRLNKQIQTLKDAMEKKRSKKEPKTGVARNPEYVKNLDAFRQIDAELAASINQAKAAQKRIAHLERRIAKAPQVEREFLLLQRRLAGANANYQSMLEKLREARIGESLELERKSERFSLIEPATRPTEPIKPNRPMYMLMAVFLATGLSGGLVFALETLRAVIRGPKAVTAIVGQAPMVILPVLDEFKKVAFFKRKKVIFSLILMLLILGGAAAYFLVLSDRGVSLSGIISTLERKISNLF